MAFAKQRSLGASINAPLSDGLVKIELANYWQQHPQTMAKQQQFNFLIGYDIELFPRLSLALQAIQNNFEYLMTYQRAVLLFAGFLVLLSIALTQFINLNFM